MTARGDDGWGERGWYPPSRPLAVTGGIKARSQRGAIGEQWWSRRFIDVLESFGMTGGCSAAAGTRGRARCSSLTSRRVT